MRLSNQNISERAPNKTRYFQGQPGYVGSLSLGSAGPGSKQKHIREGREGKSRTFHLLLFPEQQPVRQRARTFSLTLPPSLLPFTGRTGPRRIQLTGFRQGAARDNPSDVEAIQAQQVVQPRLHGVPRGVSDRLLQGNLMQGSHCSKYMQDLIHFVQEIKANVLLYLCHVVPT